MKLRISGILSALLLCSLMTVAACQAATLGHRGEAHAALARIQKSAPPDSLYQEYASIMETWSRAEQLWEQNRLEEAGKLFELVLLKISLFEQELASLPADSAGETVPVTRRPVPEAAAPPVAASPPPERSRAAEQAAGHEPSPEPQGPAPDEPRERVEDAGAVPAAPVMIVGEKRIYTVRKGDTLRLVGAKFGVNWRLIAKQNRLNPAKHLRAGQKLTINTRRIVPKTVENGIVINIPDRTLYFFKDRKLQRALPVGLGMTRWREMVTWRTPTGKFRILSKIKDPTWHVPTSIQEKMKLEGKPVKTLVPPGDDNPLGKFALKTSLPGILIHGTIFPESVYTFSSHGCIRVLPTTMKEIFNEIRVNTTGEIIYQPVKIARAEDGRVYLEVHQDVYNRFDDLQELAKRMIRKNNADLLVDWRKVSASLKNKSGVPEDITRPEALNSLAVSNSHALNGEPTVQ